MVFSMHEFTAEQGEGRLSVGCALMTGYYTLLTGYLSSPAEN